MDTDPPIYYSAECSTSNHNACDGTAASLKLIKGANPTCVCVCHENTRKWLAAKEMRNMTDPDPRHYGIRSDGAIGVDPQYAAKNPAWHGLIMAASEASQIAHIGKTPYVAVTREQEEMWKNHILTKIATEPDGTHMLEIVARWLQQFAERWSAPLTADDD